jgi:phytoene dehydrogenase-like protein
MDQNYDIVIAGGGLAGLTAAVTAARLGRKTLVLTGDIIGGQLLSIEKIEGFPGFPDGVPGYDLAPMTQEEAASAGAEFAAAELMNLAPDTGGWRLATSEGEVADARRGAGDWPRRCASSTCPAKRLRGPGREPLRKLRCTAAARRSPRSSAAVIPRCKRP